MEKGVILKVISIVFTLITIFRQSPVLLQVQECGFLDLSNIARAVCIGVAVICGITCICNIGNALSQKLDQFQFDQTRKLLERKIRN